MMDPDFPEPEPPEEREALEAEELETEEPAEELGGGSLSFAQHLWGRFDVVAARAAASERSLRLVASLLQEQAVREEEYGKALGKAARSGIVVAQEQQAREDEQGRSLLRDSAGPQAPPPAPASLTQGWLRTLAALESIGKQRIGFARSLSSSIVQAIVNNARQLAVQHQQLVAQGQSITHAVEASRAAYDKTKARLQHVQRDVALARQTRDRAQEAAAGTPTEAEESTLTKLLESVSPVATLRKLEERLRDAEADEVAARALYVEAVESVNVQIQAYDTAMTEVLGQLQAEEEARIVFLKERLEHLELAYSGLCLKTSEAIAPLDALEAMVSGEADGQRFVSCISSLSGAECVTEAARLASERRRSTRGMLSSLSEVVAVETAYSKAILKLAHGHGSITHYQAMESSTVREAWLGCVRRLVELGNAHSSFARSARDPSLSLLSHVDQEYTAARKNLLNVHAAALKELSAAETAQQKMKSRYDRQCRELQERVDALEKAQQDLGARGARGEGAREEGDVNPLFSLLMSETPEQRVPRLEAKVEQCRTERDASEAQFIAASTALSQQQDAYASCVETVRAGFRLSEVGRVLAVRQVLEQLAQSQVGLLGKEQEACARAADAIACIDATIDVEEFITAHIQPKPAVPPLGIGLSPPAVPLLPPQPPLPPLPPLSLPPASPPSPLLRPRQRSASFPGEEPDAVASPVPMDEAEEVGAAGAVTAVTALGAVGAVGADKGEASPMALSEASEFAHLGTFSDSDSDAGGSEHDGPSSASGSPHQKRTSWLKQAARPDELVRRFGLPASESIVDSYSCALLSGGLPLHGRLYVSQHYAAFQGWRDSTVVIPFDKVTNIEKKTSALVIPNAIEISVKATRYFFVSFLYREDCFARLTQMTSINKSLTKLFTPVATTAVEIEGRSDDEAPPPPLGEEGGDEEAGDSGEGEDETPVPDDVGLRALELVLDTEFSMSVDESFQRLWAAREFYGEFLRGLGDSEISTSEWQELDLQNLSQGDKDAQSGDHEPFTHARDVGYKHDRRATLGPRYATTAQRQLYRRQPSRVVVLMTTRFSDIPYADTFSVHSRWVFTRSGRGGRRCSCRIGVRVDFHRSSWLKSTILSQTLHETKATYEAWAQHVVSSSPSASSSSDSADASGSSGPAGGATSASAAPPPAAAAPLAVSAPGSARDNVLPLLLGAIALLLLVGLLLLRRLCLAVEALASRSCPAAGFG